MKLLKEEQTKLRASTIQEIKRSDWDKIRQGIEKQ